MAVSRLPRLTGMIVECEVGSSVFLWSRSWIASSLDRTVASEQRCRGSSCMSASTTALNSSVSLFILPMPSGVEYNAATMRVKILPNAHASFRCRSSRLDEHGLNTSRISGPSQSCVRAAPLTSMITASPASDMTMLEGLRSMCANP